MIYHSLLFILLTQTPLELYNQGNAFYKDNRYAEAIQSYEAAAALAQHPDILYNLGNAYFKQGYIGKAILNYRRARFLFPRDHDVTFNLSYARNYRVDKIKNEENPFAVLMQRMFRILSMKETQVLTTVLFMLFMFLLSVFIITRRSLYGYISLAVTVLCLFTGLNWIAWSNTLHARNSVITIPEVSVLSGPGDDYKEILILHDGAEVRIREIRGEYALIQIPGGLGGWIPIVSLEEIF